MFNKIVFFVSDIKNARRGVSAGHNTEFAFGYCYLYGGLKSCSSQFTYVMATFVFKICLSIVYN